MAVDDLEVLADDALDNVQEPIDHTAGRSNVDRIRQRHARKKRHIDLAIPEWDGDVVVRFGRVPKKALLAASRRKGNPTRSNAQLLVAACQEILIVDEDSGETRPAREADGNPGDIRFDGRLADLFGLSAHDPVDIVIGMYADDIAIGRHAQRIFAWQTGEDLDTFTADDVEEEAAAAGEQ